VVASPCRKKRYLRVPFIIKKENKGKEITKKDHEFEIKKHRYKRAKTTMLIIIIG